jgi:hypothetical protein
MLLISHQVSNRPMRDRRLVSMLQVSQADHVTEHVDSIVSDMKVSEFAPTVWVVLLLLSTASSFACAQSSPKDAELAQETQARGYWTDPSTGLIWAGKDNGKEVNWHQATKYCRDLRLAGYSDWRLVS